MNPRVNVARSSFPVRQFHKTAFSASYLVPIYLEEVMPGDMFNIGLDVVSRTAIPIVPVQDNWMMDIQFYFSPNRIVWDNWERMLGAQDNPGDTINYAVPYIDGPAGGYALTTVFDYMGLPTAGQVTGSNYTTHSALPLRHYNKIYNDWYRDQNLINSVPVPTGNGPDSTTYYTLLKRGKRHDYFTAALPSPQKGAAVTFPLGTTAPVMVSNTIATGNSVRLNVYGTTTARQVVSQAVGTGTTWSALSAAGQPVEVFADLTAASAASINTVRTAIATQQLLERDARAGTRYVETVYAHWGVRPQDFRLDRPEYLGGGTIPIQVNAIPQTSATGLTGGTTPAGNLAATGYAKGRVGFNYSALEHGYIIGIASVRADLTYSQGMRRHWSRRTRFDFPYPEFANLGEQAILNKEIYSQGSLTGGIGTTDPDMQVFGYIPRYDECRHFPSMITGLYKPTAAGNIAYWHSSQRFNSLPTLNQTFMDDSTNTVLERNFTGGAATAGQQFLCDFLFTGRVARPLPTHAIPGLTRF